MKEGYRKLFMQMYEDFSDNVEEGGKDESQAVNHLEKLEGDLRALESPRSEKDDLKDLAEIEGAKPSSSNEHIDLNEGPE